MTKLIGRRKMLKSMLVAGAGLGLAGGSRISNLFPAASAAPGNPAEDPSMPFRPLGQTGHQVKLFSLGGESTVEQRDQKEKAVAIINRALDRGVNYIDTSPRYGNGGSEENIGTVMATRRKEVFLATKNPDYSYDGAMRGCEQSLTRLKTDYIDLYQHHGVQNERQLARVLDRDGALKAFRKLQEEGVIRFLGISSHSPKVLLEAINKFDYDCTLVTINAVGKSAWPWAMNDSDYLDRFLKVARDKKIGVVGMKVTGRGNIFPRGLNMEQAFSYTLSMPIATAVIGITELAQIDENVEIASRFNQLNDEQMKRIEQIAAG